MNRTPFVQTFLFFANASAHSNPDYQVFFPRPCDGATATQDGGTAAVTDSLTVDLSLLEQCNNIAASVWILAFDVHDDSTDAKDRVTFLGALANTNNDIVDSPIHK